MSTLPERWLRIAVRGVEEDLAPLVAEALIEAGGRAAVEEEGEWVSYFEPPSDPEGFVARFRAMLSEVLPVPCEVDWRWQPHRDWEVLWRAGLGARRVGARLVAAPSWDPPQAGADEIVVWIDPGMAFGTAEHATTRIALRLLEGTVADGDELLDVGSGSAILAIAAAKLGARSALAIEIDPYACAEAEENVRKNGVEDRVVVHAARFERAPSARHFSVVVSNMVRTRLVAALPGMGQALAPGGRLVLSGCEAHEASGMLDHLAEVGFSPERVLEDEGWWGGVFLATGQRWQ